MSYTYVNVTLTPGQIKKLKSKSAKTDGTTIMLKSEQMNKGEHKLSLTARQKKHYDDAVKAKRGVQLKFAKAAVSDMEKHGGIFPFIIPALAALATGALSGAAGFGVKKILDKVTGGAINTKKGKGLRLPGSRFTRTYPE